MDIDKFIVDFAKKHDCVPEMCTYVDYHPDIGRVPEHWVPKIYVKEVVLAALREAGSK